MKYLPSTDGSCTQKQLVPCGQMPTITAPAASRVGWNTPIVGTLEGEVKPDMHGVQDDHAATQEGTPVGHRPTRASNIETEPPILDNLRDTYYH